METNNKTQVYKLSSLFLPMENSKVEELQALDQDLIFIFNTFCKFINLRGWTFYFLNVHNGEIRGYLREVKKDQIFKPHPRYLSNFIAFFNMCFHWKKFHHTFRHDDLGFGYIARISKPVGETLTMRKNGLNYNPHLEGLDIGVQKSEPIVGDEDSIDDTIV